MITALMILVIVLVAAGIIVWWLIPWATSLGVDWRRKLEEPVIIAALVAAVVTGVVAVTNAVATMVSGAIAASNQKDAEIEKLRAATVLSVLQQYESSMVPARNEENQKQRMKILIQSGLIPDRNGSICMALIKEGCPIKVLKAP